MKTEINEMKRCAYCGAPFYIFDTRQRSKKYCSEKCKKQVELIQKRERAKKKAADNAKKERKPRKSKPTTYRDPDTGAIYIKDKDKLDEIRVNSQAAGLSYGQYTSKDYAPTVYGGEPIKKEKEYKMPVFTWKESRKK